MSIYANAVKKPISTIMIFMAVIVLGSYSLTNLPVDLYPEIEAPYITVMTTYVGANAEEIETNVTKVIEDGLNSVDNLQEITSESQDNMSIVTLEFDWETDLTEAMNNIRDAVEMVKDGLPEDCENPLMFKFGTSSMPILFYAISAEESFDGLDKLLEDKLINPLNRVDGIGSVTTMGAPGRRVYVDCDARKLDAYGISIEQIGQIIGAENLNMPSGHLKMGQYDYQLRIDGEFKETHELENLIIANNGGNIVHLRDVATIRDKAREKEQFDSFYGKPGIRLMVMKQSGANSVDVATDVKAAIEELRADLPSDIEFFPILDTSDDIVTAIKNLSQTIMYALIFVILVVLLFLGRWRATFIIVLTIPISLIVSFAYLYMTGSSINIISLSSLSIAIGMVVDDAIVVLENITKHIERGSSPREAAIYATKEVWLSVIATTLVVVAVFLPLTLVGGQTGIMFKELGWIVTITVVTSTLAAITLTPMLSALLLKKRIAVDGKKTLYERTILRALDGLDNAYGRTVAWSITHKRWVGLAVIAIVVVSALFVPYLKFENFPETDDSYMEVTAELQTGMRMEESRAIGEEIEAFIKNEIPEAAFTFTSAGADDEGGVMAIFMPASTHSINMRVRTVEISERDRDIWELADVLRTKLESVPEIVNYNVSTTSSSMSGGAQSVDVEIYGFDLKETTILANEVADRMRSIEGAADIRISREKEKPQLQIVFDRDKLAQYGLNTATASMAVRNRVSGMVASKFREDGDEYDIVVRYNEDERSTIQDLSNITIMSPRGTLLKVSELGRIEEYWAPPKIQHKRRERVVTVSATASQGMSLSEVAEAVKEEMKYVDVPSGIEYNIGGSYEDMVETSKDLGKLLIIIILLVFIVMAAQFESLKMPLIIMVSILFSFCGVILSLYITDTTMSTIAMLGAILLVGIVVKNGIVLIDFINLLRERGVHLHEAVIEACKSRLRPILMTAMTTVLGMLPMALSVTEGSEIWAPMGITVIGGLIFSTIITLIVLPVAYVLLAKSGARDKKAKIQAKFVFLDKA